MKDMIFDYVKRKYNSDIEHLWARTPECAVFRREDNNKWYGIVMDVSKEKFGIKDIGVVYVLNVKIDDIMLHDVLLQKEGYYPAYHMNKEKWISIFLDGTVPIEEIKDMIDMSYQAVAPKKRKRKEN